MHGHGSYAMGLEFAYDISDSLATPVNMLEWLAHHRQSVRCCLICRENLTVKVQNSQITTYFSQLPGSSCPTVTSSPPSGYINSLPKQKGEAAQARQFARDNMMGVYMRMRDRVPAMRWAEFEEACTNARRLRVWDLVGLTPEYVLSVLLSCKDKFVISAPKAKEVAFFLEPNPQSGSFWSFPIARKRNLFEVEIKTGSLQLHPIDFRLAKGDILARIHALLSP